MTRQRRGDTAAAVRDARRVRADSRLPAAVSESVPSPSRRGVRVGRALSSLLSTVLAALSAALVASRSHRLDSRRRWYAAQQGPPLTLPPNGKTPADTPNYKRLNPST